MGRPSKNPNHPLVRLRKTLSITRAQLAKRARVPESTLHDIELGKFKLSPEIAIKIGLSVWVNPRSLLNGDDPLLDAQGREFSADSPKYDWITAIPEFREARQQLFEAVWDAAYDKKIVSLLAFSFEAWVLSTIEAFGLETLVPQKLTKRLHSFSFDPGQISPGFRPKSGQLAVAWKALSEQIDQEHQRIHDRRKIDYRIPADSTPRQRMCLETAFNSSCLQEARENLREKEIAAKMESPLREKQLMDLKARIIKNAKVLRAAKIL